MAKAPAPLALPKIDLADYQRAYQAHNGEPIEAEPLVASILAAFIAADRGFTAWRKANPAPRPGRP